MKHNMIRSITLAALIMVLPFTIGATSTAPVLHNNKKMVTNIWIVSPNHEQSIPVIRFVSARGAEALLYFPCISNKTHCFQNILIQ